MPQESNASGESRGRPGLRRSKRAWPLEKGDETRSAAIDECAWVSVADPSGGTTVRSVK